MAVRLVDIAEGLATVTVKVRNGSFPVVYRPDAIYPGSEDILNREISEADSTMPILEHFARLVVNTGLTGPLVTREYLDLETGEVIPGGEEIVPDGAEIPPQPEYMRHVRSDIVNAIIRAIRRDLSPVEEDPKKPSRQSRATLHRVNREAMQKSPTGSNGTT